MLKRIIKTVSKPFLFIEALFACIFVPAINSFLCAQTEQPILNNQFAEYHEALPLIMLAFATLVTILMSLTLKMLRLNRKISYEHLTSERLFEMISIGPDGYYAFIYYPENILTGYNDINDRFSNYNEDQVKQECSRTLALMLGLSSGMSASFSQVAEKFRDEDRRSLVKAVEDLRRYGTTFSGIYRLHNDEKIFRIKGNRAISSSDQVLCDVIWVRDVSSDLAKIDSLEAQLALSKNSRNMNRAMLDSLPSPVWLRGDDLSITWCNKAYAKMIDFSSPKEAALQSEELIKGDEQRHLRALAASARAARDRKIKDFHIIVGGKRRLIKISETPFEPAEYKITENKDQLYTTGFAYDVTDNEEVTTNSEIIKKQNDDIWKNLNTAVAIFDKKSNLTFYNYSFIKIWDLDEEQLIRQPSYSFFLDMLRDKRMLPETSDYDNFKTDELKIFSSLIDSKEDLLHLSSGITIRRVILPHHSGGLMIIYEDITDKLAMEHSYNTLLAVQNDTINHMHEAVAVFGSDCRLKLSNPAYSELWKIDKEVLDKSPNINQLIEWQNSFFSSFENWEEIKEEMLQKLTDRSSRTIKISRSDGVTLESKSVALPDGGFLITYIDITDKEKFEKILKEQNYSMKTASRMRTRFLASVSDEFKEPLTEIMDYSENIEKQISKPKAKITKKSKEAIKSIYENAKKLKENINNIIDLASIEAGQMPLTLNTFDIRQMLDGVVAMTANKIKKRNMELNFNCQDNIGWIVGDEKRIKQSLYYMIGHSVASANSNNKIFLSATKEIYESKGECIIFCISSIFEKNPYFPEFETELSEGWYEVDGMGYNMVKKFVEQHHGLIEVKNNKDNFTNIYIILPTNS